MQEKDVDQENSRTPRQRRQKQSFNGQILSNKDVISRCRPRKSYI